MVFSKPYCPYCKMAKKVLDEHKGKEFEPDEYEVMEIDSRPDCGEIQRYLQKLTGASTVSISHSSFW